MEYSLTMLTNAADCQALINLINSERQGLSYKKQGLELKQTSSTLTTAEIEAELASLNAELPALQNMVDILPEGPAKIEAIRRLKTAEFKKFTLEDKKRNYGVIKLLEREYEITCNEKDVQEADSFVVAITARMAELPQ